MYLVSREYYRNKMPCPVNTLLTLKMIINKGPQPCP